MNTHRDTEVVLTADQKRQIDEIIIQFSQKQISIIDMYSRIEAIRFSNMDNHVFSDVHVFQSRQNIPVHIP